VAKAAAAVLAVQVFGHLPFDLFDLLDDELSDAVAFGP